MSVEKKTAGNGTFAALYCAIFGTPGFCKSSMFFETSIASLDKKQQQQQQQQTVQIPAILHTVHHVYRSVWPAREAKPRFDAALVCSAHDCESRFFCFMSTVS